MLSKQCGHHASKSIAIAATGLPGISQELFKIGNEFRLRQLLDQLLDDFVDRFVENYFANWLCLLMQTRRDLNISETAITTDDFSLCYLNEIVILGRDPKDRNGFGLSLRQAAGKIDCT